MSKKIISILLIILFLGFIFSLPRILRVQGIDCESQLGACNDDLSKRLDEYSGLNIIESKSRISQALRGDITVAKYAIYFKLPTRLSVVVVEKTPKFALSAKDRKKYMLIAKDGEILSESDSINLPVVIQDIKSYTVGEKVDEPILFSLNIIYDLSKSYKVIDNLYDESKLTVELEGGLRVLFPLEGDRRLLTGSFIFVHNELKKSEAFDFDQNKIKVIDLRFKNPVLRSG